MKYILSTLCGVILLLSVAAPAAGAEPCGPLAGTWALTMGGTDAGGLIISELAVVTFTPTGLPGISLVSGQRVLLGIHGPQAVEVAGMGAAVTLPTCYVSITVILDPLNERTRLSLSGLWRGDVIAVASAVDPKWRVVGLLVRQD